MKRSTLFTLTFILTFTLALPLIPLRAQTPSGQLDEPTRLMQEYMARREEWLVLRRDAFARAAKAPDEATRKQIKAKLADDEKPPLSRMAEAARAYQAAEQQKKGPRPGS